MGKVFILYNVFCKMEIAGNVGGSVGPGDVVGPWTYV